ncbi:MAG: alpha/beta hydrolase [Candidatus Diapherotrites archaeon]
MEKVSFQNASGQRLAGAFYAGKSETCILVVHGFLANKDRARLVKMAEKLNKAGYSVLRFDFGACGESEQRIITLHGQVEDFSAAIQFLEQKRFHKFGVWAESLGALVALQGYLDKIKAMVLWAPVTHSKKPPFVERGEFHESFEDKNVLLHSHGGREFKISKEYLKEREAVVQEKLLSPVLCPILLICGTEDTFVPFEHSQKAMQFLSKNSKLELFENIGHGFDSIEEKVQKLSLEWFEKFL